MRISTLTFALAFSLTGALLHATDVINMDQKAYKVKVQGEGKLSISTHNLPARGSLYGLCGYDFCTFEIPGSKTTAKKNDRITIENGKFK